RVGESSDAATCDHAHTDLRLHSRVLPRVAELEGFVPVVGGAHHGNEERCEADKEPEFLGCHYCPPSPRWQEHHTCQRVTERARTVVKVQLRNYGAATSSSPCTSRISGVRVISPSACICAGPVAPSSSLPRASAVRIAARASAAACAAS